MKAFLKTLFGDPQTVVVVSIVLIAEVALAAVGQAALGALLVPIVVLAGVAWLALR